MPRAQFKPKTRADQIRAVLASIPPAELAEPRLCLLAVKNAKVKVADSVVYNLRKKMLENGNGKHVASEYLDLCQRVDAVKKAAKAVGGLEVLKSTISFIEKVRGI